MDKTEWPTVQKMKELRADGVVPFSIGSQVSIAAVVLFGLTLFFRDRFAWIFSEYFELFPKAAEQPTLLIPYAERLYTIFFFPACTVGVIALGWGLSQTLLLFQPKALSFDLGRLAFRVNFSLLGLFRNLVVTALRFIFLTLLFVSLFAVGFYLFSGLLTRQQVDFFPAFLHLLAIVSAWVVGGALFLSLFLFAFERIAFRRRNMMSRAEREEEMRE